MSSISLECLEGLYKPSIVCYYIARYRTTMLSQLSIQNFGLIDQVTVEFHEHLNVLTGETGAGKSIIIDALRVALGDRMSNAQLRDPQKSCHIEANFNLTNQELKNSALFKDFLSEEDPALIIQRTYQPDGRHKIKINGFSVTLGQLKEIGNHLIDFHGPHDHQMLLSQAAHMEILDRLIDFSSLVTDYQALYAQYLQLQKKSAELQTLSHSRERELDLLSHQIKELEQVPLNDQRCEELLQQQTRVNNTERLAGCVAQLMDLLKEDGNGTTEKIRQAFSPMSALNHIDAQTVPLMEYLTQLQETNSQLLAALNDYSDQISFEPQEAQAINEKVDIFEDIKRKYGPTLAQAQKFYDSAKERFDLLSNLEHNDAQLRSEIQNLEKKLKQIAAKISGKRKNAAQALQKIIEKELSELGIAHVKFECRVEPSDLHDHGQDRVTFYLSPNLGVELKPLSEIVSTGEAARVMLALKKALIKVDPIPVLIFDEIDAQIGGRLGTITGQKLREISRGRQVILITHLPQIASFADAHFKVIKTAKTGRACTTIEELGKEERVRELAQMMSGKTETKISIQHARDMLVNANA